MGYRGNNNLFWGVGLPNITSDGWFRAALLGGSDGTCTCRHLKRHVRHSRKSLGTALHLPAYWVKAFFKTLRGVKRKALLLKEIKQKYRCLHST
jgi:hypothetical protein